MSNFIAAILKSVDDGLHEGLSEAQGLFGPYKMRCQVWTGRDSGPWLSLLRKSVVAFQVLVAL